MIKKLFSILLISFMLFGCDLIEKEDKSNEAYINMIETINDRTTFVSFSNYFDISTDIVRDEEGYRYYVIIDNPRIAMYGVEAIAIENGVDYTKTMAPCVGIFEENEYNMIPGQTNPDEGFVEGFSISGVSNSSNPTLHLLVSWHGKNQDITQEFFEITVKENNE